MILDTAQTAQSALLIANLQEVQFAEPNGCVRCVKVCMDAYPKMTWATFTLVWSESETVRGTFTTAVELSEKQAKQAFTVLSSVEAHSLIGVRLERKYLALTEHEVLTRFMLPPDGFDTDLKSISLLSEDGEPTTYYLFESGEDRKVVLSSERQVLHMDHLLNGQNQLRKEQPLERWQVCCQQEVTNRRPQPTLAATVKAAAKAKACGSKVDKVSPWSLMTLQEASSKATSIIAAREAAEADVTAKPSDGIDVEKDLENEFVRLETVGLTSMTPTAEPKANSGKRPRAKDTAAPKRAGRARRTTAEMPAPAPPSLPSANAAPSTAGSDTPDPDTPEGLGAIIKAKLGIDVRSIKNLDIHRVLCGEQLGRSLVGVAWLNSL